MRRAKDDDAGRRYGFVLQHPDQNDLRPNMSTWEVVGTGAAALLWAAIFLWGGGSHVSPILITKRRSISSFGIGVSVTYVFVYMMPELHSVRRTFAESLVIPLPLEGMATYFPALIGLLAFYGVEH